MRRCLCTLSMCKRPQFVCLGFHVGSELLSQDCVQRLLPHRLESGPEWSPWPWGFGANLLVHELPREESCIYGSELLSPRPEGLPCVGLDGQLIRSLMYKSSGQVVFRLEQQIML